jgi:hypothetical protein
MRRRIFALKYNKHYCFECKLEHQQKNKLTFGAMSILILMLFYNAKDIVQLLYYNMLLTLFDITVD